MTTEAKLYATITEEALAEARAIIGVPLRRKPWNRVATHDAICGFTRAIGGRTPLFLDVHHGLDSPWGTLVAHPTWLYTVDDTVINPKLPGIHTIYGGTEWEFFRMVRMGDTITATARLVDVLEKEGKFCGRMALEVGEVEYTNQYGKRVAKARSYILRCPRDAAKERGKYLNATKYKYSLEKLQAVEASYDKEVIRESRVRYWEDVEAGEELSPVVKGPLTSDDQLAFANTIHGQPTFGVAMEERRRHPGLFFIDPNLGFPDHWEASLLKDSVAREFGFPGAHDMGLQRICWLDHLITNWMGDHAFLQKLSARVILPNIFGDTTWCKGKVVAKEQRGMDRLVHLEVWGENQRGDTTAKGSATVALVSKELDSLAPVTEF